MKKVYINRQWQGGADPVTRDGAEEIANLYLAGQEYVDLPVSTDMAVKRNGIRGFDILRRQMRSAYERLRSVMDDRCFGLLENPRPLEPSQVIHIGGRDFDGAERTFISETGLAAHTVQEVRSDGEFLRRTVRETQPGPVYIHLDLDVLDPSDFPNTPLPVGGGLRCGEVWDILNAFADRLVGLGVYEYAPARSKNAFMERLVRFGLAL